MQQPEPQTQAYHLIEEARALWGYRWRILGACMIAGVATVIYTLPAITPPEYRAVSSFVPPSIEDVKSLNFLKVKFNGFGAAADEDLERVAGALSADTAVGYMIKRFDLARRYRADDVEDPVRRAKFLREKFNANVDVKLTRFSTVQVEVFDEDPKFAAAIANEFIVYADSFIENIARRKQGLRAIEQSISEMEARRRRVQDSLGYYRSKFLLYRLEDLSEAVSQRIVAGPFQTESFHRNYDRMQALEYEMRFIEDDIVELYNEMSFRKENLATYPSLINVVGYGVPPKFKSRPQRLLLVALVVMGTFIMACFVAAYADRLRAFLRN